MGTRKHTKKEKTSNEPIGEAPAPETDRGLKRETRVELYAARRYLGLGTQQEFGLRMPVQVYFKDPAVAAAIEGAGIDTKFTTPGSRAFAMVRPALASPSLTTMPPATR